MRRAFPLLLISILAVPPGCGGGDHVSDLEQRIQDLEAENRRLRGDEEPGGETDGLDAEELKLLEGLPQEHAETPPEGAELSGLDIWATPPIGPALEVETEAEPMCRTTESVAESVAESETVAESVAESETVAESVAESLAETETESVAESGTGIVLPEPPVRGDEAADGLGEEPAERVEEGLGAGGPADDPAMEGLTGTSPPTGTRLTIHRAVLGIDVVDREPTGVATRFSREEHKVYCFTEVSILAGGSTVLVHRWSLDGAPQGQTELRIGGDRWRTFSNRTVVEKPGRWQVELIDEAGAVLETLSFTVE